MSIRIYNEGVAGSAASEAHRAEELSRANAPSKQPSVGQIGSGEDQIQISSLSEHIAAQGSVQSAQQADKVRHLAAVYQSGQYHVDSRKVSSALVANALQNARTESGE
ncbi:MAG TPA: flagellar biosynthesis anti-sigma factor FlgM [Bryobacteraceae bacterium]|nr:flagellar biosynthesis anti-sigma factor FlgM [Bryobacteraceae bacterium]